MGYEVMTYFQDYGSPPSDSNTSDWEFVGFLSGNEDSSGSRPGELETQTSNRYILQGFFENPPTVTDDSVGCPTYNGGNVFIEGTESNFSLEYPNKPDTQNSLKSTAHTPQTNYDPSSIQYTVSAGVSSGPISAEASKAYYEGPILNNTPYQNANWTLDYGTGTQDLPTSQDDGVGVMFDFAAQSTEDFVNVKFNQGYLFQTQYQCQTVPTVLYSGTGTVDLYDDISIVSP
ncbi:hypothetical protein [Halolamina salifodinae]|uniref:Uncharacterized protein n=1 Tax=Halolamina salifodinae TaxID=1202767 RepID=A0A8T4H133_9EURY|nr:hypothetical protein [Halolamina salifodinae]MBP1987295.1 hypothetical protein [Halolamina salifodinae]